MQPTFNKIIMINAFGYYFILVAYKHENNIQLFLATFGIWRKKKLFFYFIVNRLYH